MTIFHPIDEIRLLFLDNWSSLLFRTGNVHHSNQDLNLWDRHCLCTDLRCSHSSSGIFTIFSIALCLITSSFSSFSPADGYALMPAVGFFLYFSWVLGSLPWLFFFFRLSPSMPALSVRDIGAAVPAGTSHAVVRLCFQGPPDQRISRRPFDRAPWSCSAIEGSWFMTPISSWLLVVARLQLRTRHRQSSLHSLDLVPLGRRVLLDQFRTDLLIGRSRETSGVCSTFVLW